MDLEPGRIRVHEHAETGKPLAAHVHGIRSRFSPPMAPLAVGFRRAAASVGTAPPQTIVRSSAARLATNSLQSGHLTKQLVRQALCRLVFSAAPLRAARRAHRGD